jgi:imidazolonepropionase-like amidohydrolase
MAESVRDASRRAHKMGLSVIAGTDGGGSIGEEIMELVGIGMTPMEAIQAATSRSAEALGISRRTGSIRPGLEADLVVLNSNPLEDIKAAINVVLVVNDGRIAANRNNFRQARGLSHFSLGNREKSRSVEIRTHPCSMARAARCASITRFAAA